MCPVILKPKSFSFAFDIKKQIPVWITISIGLRNMSVGGGRILDQAALDQAQARLAQLSAEGFGWVQDLTLPDPYWVLPVAVGAMFLLNLEIAGARMSRCVFIFVYLFYFLDSWKFS